MKIAFFMRTFPALSETFILNQITGMLDREHEVDIYAARKGNTDKIHSKVTDYYLLKRVCYLSNYKIPPNKFIRVIKAAGFTLKGFIKDPKAILNALNIFKYGRRALSLEVLYKSFPFLGKCPYDIIHCHFGPIGEKVASLKELGIIQGRFVTTFHGQDIRLGIERGGHIYNKLFESSDCLLAISDYNYENLINFGAKPQKIVFHPIGIDINRFSFQRQTIPSKRLKTFTILTIARLVEEKGLQYGIRAINKLLEKNPRLDLEYRIIGDGQLEEQLKNLVKELNLSENVSFLGSLSQEKVIKELEKAHIFLLPSVSEALPTVILEAQAIGLPIVATNVGSVSEAMIDGKTGFLVPARDVDSLTEKLEFLIEHPVFWPEMGRGGREYVEKNYDIGKLNVKLEKIYKELIGQN
jgi:colanic acid/amylovoran biosynthesis glycosyltransferase